MGFYQEYELLGLVHDGPTKTLRAREIATDRSVFLHLLTGALAPDAQRALLARVDGLIARSSEVLKVGEFAGTRYVVTAVLDPFSTLEQWVSEKSGVAGGTSSDGTQRTALPPGDQGPSNGSQAAGDRPASLAERLSSESGTFRVGPGGLRMTSGPMAGQRGTSGTIAPAGQARGEKSPTGDTPAGTEQRTSGPADPHAASPSTPPFDRLPAPDSHITAVHDEPVSTEPGIAVPPERALRELTDALDASPGESASFASPSHEGQAQSYTDQDTLTNALESLESALKLRPNDAGSVGTPEDASHFGNALVGDDESQTRQEWHFSKAREAWEHGDLDAARDEMDRIAAIEDQQPAKDTDRSRAYVEFQRQLQDESHALASSYAEARAQMAEENVEAALEICDRSLAKYPNHALFQALKFELSERRRQESLAFVTDIDRQVDAEPDLLRRVEILEEALKRHPGEKHFTEGLRLVREKQQLVRSIIEKAHGFEQSQRFREALDQWQLIESIHGQLPGLDGNVKRLEQSMQEQRMRHEARARWISQTKRCLQAGDYDQGLKLVRNALIECPDDPDLRQLELEAGRGLQRGDTIRDHLRQAQSLWQSGRRMEGLERLRQAHQLDPRNALVRGELVNALVELARRQVESDWAAAKPMVEEILRLEPNHTAAVHLLGQISHLRREELVSWCVVETRRLRGRGDTEGAYRVVVESLEQYPEEERLLQLEASLAEEVDPALRQRPRELDSAEADAEAASDYGDSVASEASSHDAQDSLQEGQASLASAGDESAYEEPAEGGPDASYASGDDQYPSDAQSPPILSRGMDTVIVDPEASGYEDAAEAALPAVPLEPSLPELFEESLQSKPASQPPQHENGVKAQYAAAQAEQDLLSRLAVESNAPNRQKAKPPQPQAAPVQPGLMQQLQAMLGKKTGPDQAAGPFPLKPVLLGILVAIVLVGIIATIVISKINNRIAPAPVAANLAVTIQSSPPGATLVIDGQECGVSTCQVNLAAESHRVEARLAGFRAAAVSFEVNESNSGQPVIVTLLPIVPALRVSSDLSAGDVNLDGKKIGELEDGSFEWDLIGLAPGQHVLKLSNSDSAALVSFEVPAGAAPRLTAPLKVNNLKAVMIAGLGPVAQVYGNEEGLPVTLDGQAAGKLGSDALALENLSGGTHALTVGAGKDQRKVVFDSNEAPMLAAFLNSDRNVGSLRILTGEDDVRIFLNGEEFRRKTIRGRRLIYLTPKNYEVRVEKDGFRTPPAQMAKLEKGEEVQLEFQLAPLPQTATLQISNAVPGTEVWIDGQSRGTVRGNTFTIPTIEPGKHTIRLMNENYKTLELDREFSPRSTVEFNGALEAAVGTLEIQISPTNADVRMMLRREDEAIARPITDRKLLLPAGTYTVQASAPGFENYSATFQIAVNQIKIAILPLKKIEEEKPDQPSVSLADWEKAGWQREGKLIVRRGGDFSIAAASGGAGRYTFTALLQKGKRLEWVVDYTDEDNHVLYQLGKDFLQRTEVVKGKKSRTVKIPHQMKWDDFASVETTVRPDSIVHRVLVDDKWVELDNWKQPGSHFNSGKFGFHIPGRDQVGLSHFSFVPAR